jgi:NAD(P)H-hydrate epimerase
MTTEYLNSKIIYTNLKYIGINLVDSYKASAKLLELELAKDFGDFKSISIICGLGGNSGDGIALALQLLGKNILIKVYLIGRANYITDPATKELWEELYNKDIENLELKQDAYAQDIDQSDLNIECLAGTGFQGDKLNKRFADVIKRISHFTKPLIAMDVPVPSYTPDKIYSFIYPKTKDAVVIPVNLPTDANLMCGPGEVQALLPAKLKTHKSKNGKLLIIQDDEVNSEIILKTAKEYATEVEFYNINSSSINEDNKLESVIDEFDVILFKDIERNNIKTKALVNYIISTFSKKKFILSGKTLELINKENLNSLENILLIPDRTSIDSLLDEKVNISNVEGVLKRYSKRHSLNIIMLGSTTLLFNADGEFKLDKNNIAYIPSLRDVLITLIAAFYTNNDIWLSMRAATFLINRLLIIQLQNKEEILKLIKKISEIIEICKAM